MDELTPRWLRLAAQVPRLSLQLVRWGRPQRALLFGPKSLGDDLLCTAVLHEARKRGQPWTMLSARPELFLGNPDPVRVQPIDDYYVNVIAKLGAKVVQPYYARTDAQVPDRDILPPRHLIAEMCRLAGISGKVSLRPYLHLTKTELGRGVLHPRQIAVHSTARAAALPFANKEWGAANFAEVARLLSPNFKLVQLGSAHDPALPVDFDLRGKTTLRESAAVMASSLAFVGLEGFLAHLARAVDTPSAVVIGGRTRPEIVGYTANQNFYSPVPCAPCGLRNTCAFDRKCLQEIIPANVARAARRLAEQPRGPLVVDTAFLE